MDNRVLVKSVIFTCRVVADSAKNPRDMRIAQPFTLAIRLWAMAEVAASSIEDGSRDN